MQAPTADLEAIATRRLQRATELAIAVIALALLATAVVAGVSGIDEGAAMAIATLELIACVVLTLVFTRTLRATWNASLAQAALLARQNRQLQEARDASGAMARARDPLAVRRTLLESGRAEVADISEANVWMGEAELAVGTPQRQAADERRVVQMGRSLYLPLVSGDQLVGVIGFTRTAEGWTEQEIPFLELLASSAAPVFVTRTTLSKLREEKEEAAKLAITDELTGLFNRHFMQEQLDLLVAHSERLLRPFCVVAFDVDHLKEVNDAHGHAAGDELLKRFAGVLRSKLRGEDVAIRTGGDEFVALLPETDIIGGVRTAERIRAATRASPGAVDLRFSAGVAAWRPGRDGAAILAAADKLLYEVKSTTRDAVLEERNA